ncbi:hypothetical protein Leryth_019046 [Lithospermum erythrorhizon]|nr:hypothetical protein Leryth_019046 [Lithospermum erythrorhizon]
MGSSACCVKDRVKKGAWTPEEDKILVDYIKDNGVATWRSLPKLAGSIVLRKRILSSRCLDWKQVASIASHLPGRTDNEIKNFWNSHLKKRFATKGPEQQKNRSGVLVKAIDSKPETATTRHMMQWKSARVEAEARLSMDPLLLNPLVAVKTESDYFLRLWNSNVGESFRGATVGDGVICGSTGSQSSSSIKVDDSGSGMTVQQGEWIKRHGFTVEKQVYANQTICKTGSDSSKSCKLEDSRNSLEPLLFYTCSISIGSQESNPNPHG